MILINELKGIMVSKGYTQATLAKKLGMAERTLNLKLKKGVFGSDEIDMLIEILNIQHPELIFYVKNLT